MVPNTKAALLASASAASMRKNRPTHLLFEKSINSHDDVQEEVAKRQILPQMHNTNSLGFLGPTTLVGGGTAIFCSSALRSTTLTPLSVLYMLLLAIQYSIQPRISKKYLHKDINKRSVTLVEEAVKFIMASTILCTSQTKSKLLQIFQDWSLSSSLLVAGLPASLYAVQGILYICGYQNLDSVTFNGLTQTKMLWAALCCFLILGQVQSPIQILSLVLVGFSALLFQGTLSQVVLSRNNDTMQTKSTTRRRFTHGIVPCLVASFLSGLAGALSQKGLQQFAGHGTSSGRNAYLYTMEISGFSALTLILSMIFNKQKPSTNSTRNNSFFQHWSWSTMYPILLKAVGGVLTALVHKYAGSVAKGFALICGLVLSGVIQTLLDHKRLSIEQVIGMLLVNLSSWLHFTNPQILKM